MVAVGVVSPRKLIRSALCTLLLALPMEEGLNILFDVGSFVEATERIIASKPHVLIIDCERIAGCFSYVHRVRDIAPSTRCLLLTDNAGEESELQAARSGAWGLVTETADPELVQQAIRKVVRGEMWFSHATMARTVESLREHKFPENSGLERLTAREAEVTALLAQGFQNKEIAQRLYLSENTVRRYTETIYRKLGVNSRLEVAVLYHQRSSDP